MQRKVMPKCFYYTPASQRPERLTNLPSDEYVSVFDLEDAVPICEKQDARAALGKVFSQESNYYRAVRINSVDSIHVFDDIKFLSSLSFRPDIIILSMVQDADEIRIVKNWLPDTRCHFYSTIETPASLLKIDGIARESDGLVFGSGDLSAFFASEITWENMLHARFLMVTAACAYGIPAIDSVCFLLEDLPSLEDECRRVRELGFYGKAAPHPSHIALINRTFDLSADKLADLEELIAASDQHSGRIFRRGSDMIGPPHVRRAKQIKKRAFWPEISD
ncbi:HpcH/HpaI aldolase/citrate lyase family protein [Burkholderia glumae]|uniref:HpcH/HpaI aldolase/citrate lyase family protein n=1 Tax=Burkholderia glumae TaxID=337 RepID=UPI0012F8B698|nr:aldolase/citrate lyase family protein [Burkholderia glumae]